MIGSDLIMLLWEVCAVCAHDLEVYPIPEHSVSPPPPAPEKSWKTDNKNNQL